MSPGAGAGRAERRDNKRARRPRWAAPGRRGTLGPTPGAQDSRKSAEIVCRPPFPPFPSSGRFQAYCAHASQDGAGVGAGAANLSRSCPVRGAGPSRRPSLFWTCIRVIQSPSDRFIQSPSHPVSESSDAVANCRMSARPSPRRRGIFLAASLAAAPARPAGCLYRAHVFCRWLPDPKQVWAGQESKLNPLAVTGLCILERSLVFGSSAAS